MTNTETSERPALLDGKRRYFLSTTSSTLVGRQGCAILLSDSEVALRHARLSPTRRGFTIEPVDGSVYVNDEEITQAFELSPGDEIKIGSVTLGYEGPSLEGNLSPVLSYEQLFEKVKSSVVGLQTPSGQGSGFFAHENGLIITNRHVVGYEREVQVELVDGKRVEGRVVRSFPEIDLAFIRVNIAPILVPPLAPDGSSRVGQSILVIGNPMGLSNTLTRGVISAVNREIMGNVYLQTDAAVNPGNSGGPLFNELGEVIGVASMGLQQKQGLNFAIPVEVVRRRLEQFSSEESRVKRGQGVYCVVCGSFNTGGVYCHHCGVSLSSVQMETKSSPNANLQCSNCGKVLTPGDQFCSGCGTHI